FAPVSTTLAADPAYVILYNPGSSSITVTYDTGILSGQTISVPAKGTNYVLMPAAAAHFYTTGGEKFSAISVIDADATSNATHDWSYSLVPETYLTDKFIVAWGPGNNNSPTTGAANGSPVWVTPTENTTLYIDSATVTVKNAAGTAISGTLDSGTTYKYSVNKLESYRIFDNSDNNQSGLTVYTKDGTLITGAWGEDPSIAGAGNPFLDMGTTVLPYPDYVLTKEATEANTTDTNDILELGEQEKYTLTAVNHSVIDMIAPIFTDSWTPSAVSYVSNSATLTVYDTDGTTVIYQNTDLDGSANTFPLAGSSGYTLNDVNPGVAGIQGLKFGQKIVIDYKLQLPSISDPSAIGQLAANNYQISNTASLNDQAGISKQSVNLTPITTPITDGEVFLYNSGFTAVQTTYTPGTTIGLQVTDADQNKITGSVETLTVKVTNNSTNEYETVTLTETGNNTGIFRGTLSTSSTSSNNTNDSGTLY
ncbi:MAG: hypothetical protein EBR59_10395, partial [Methylococcaceae bacterium]|nr:hypothetical protein [Methylococcaceae bacterium]